MFPFDVIEFYYYITYKADFSLMCYYHTTFRTPFDENGNQYQTIARKLHVYQQL